MKKRSFRWISSRDLDVDAFQLAGEGWFLFAIQKSAQPLALAELGERFTRQSGEVVVGVGGAQKQSRDSSPLEPWFSGPVPEELWCREGWLKFRLEPSGVLNPGLFLDQAANRLLLATSIEQWIQENKGAFGSGDGVLNLFSYTGSFSVTAFGAGAKAVTSVDVSRRYQQWERQNVEANFGGMSLEHRLFSDDARDVLRRAEKRGDRYRWIVLDPPTFSRGEGKAFRVREELAELASSCLKILTPGGELLVAANDADWAERDFLKEMDEVASEFAARLSPGQLEPSFPKDHPLKSVWISTDRANA